MKTMLLMRIPNRIKALWNLIVFTNSIWIRMYCWKAQFLYERNYGLAYNDYAKLCAPVIECDANAKYRNIDGSCNNLMIPWIGATKTPHLRILDACYSDGKCASSCVRIQHGMMIWIFKLFVKFKVQIFQNYFPIFWLKIIILLF